MKYLKRYSVIFFAIVLLFSLVPFQAFAVDPVSASVIANAFAQAIASYGAANGVAMTFDVSSTDGIGESVHELWKDFREGTQTADDYATIAQAIFPELYYKTATAIGTASDAVAVGVHISSEYADELDDFYNWLLSGPAEMVQVDNQYYEFSQAQIGDNASPIVVLSYSELSSYSVPYGDPALSDAQLSSVGSTIFSQYWSANDERFVTVTASSASSSVFGFWYSSGSSWRFTPVVTDSSLSVVSVRHDTYGNGSYARTSYSSYTSDSNYPGFYYVSAGPFVSKDATGLTLYYPSFSSVSDGLAVLSSLISSGSSPETVGVKSYTPSGIADIPDTADPNYDALNRAKDIPLNIPWDDAIYGDGTGILTDAQSAAIAGDLTQALETDRTVELVEEQDIPIQPDYSDVLLPLIPINVPSFNFSLSGIWHYVRSWVTSLGAWLSMMFSVWGILPYAIVVPVYACLVIVIVLGLYKRFFM